MINRNETTTGDNPNTPTPANIKRNIERALHRLDSITSANAANEIETARGLLRICKADIERIEQPESELDAETIAVYRITDNPATSPEVKKVLLDYLFEKNGMSVEFTEVETNGANEPATAATSINPVSGFDQIRLTREQAADLSEWIFSTDYGIVSADAFDDRAKQALLVILAAVTYADSDNRENILFEVMARIFGYSFAADAAQNEFIRAGFLAYTGGDWKPKS